MKSRELNNICMNEMGYKLSDARDYLKNNSIIDRLTDHILKIRMYNSSRSDNLNGWKKEIHSYLDDISKRNFDKSNKPNNFTEGDILSIWDRNLSSTLQVDRLLKSWSNQGFPDISSTSEDIESMKNFINTEVSDYILLGDLNINWELLIQ